MHDFALYAFAVVALTASPPQRASPPANTPEASQLDLASAFGSSAVAYIYIVGRNFLYPGDLSPDDVRSEGCAYRVHRDSPQWAELEQTLTRADVRIVPGTMRPDLRVGLVLSGEMGRVSEIYSNDLDLPNGRRPGVSQGRLVEMSPSFANLLHVFVALHPELALSDAGRVEHRPRAARRGRR
jgi:hypothetical protein